MTACAHALCLPYGGCQFDNAVHTDAHGNVVDTCGHCTLRTFAGITARSIQSGCPVHSERDMTAPRRVPTEVERTAGHVRLDPTAGVIARLGVALEESRREVHRLHVEVAERTRDRDDAWAGAKNIYGTLKTIERERNTAIEVARSNKRHVGYLTAVLDAIADVEPHIHNGDVSQGTCSTYCPGCRIRTALNAPAVKP